MQLIEENAFVECYFQSVYVNPISPFRFLESTHSFFSSPIGKERTRNRNYFFITTQRPPSVVISHFPSRWLDRTSSLTLSAVTLTLPIAVLSCSERFPIWLMTSGGVCFPNPPPTKAIPAVLRVL